MGIRIIGGRLRNRTIETTTSAEARPTSSKLRESLFNIFQHEIENSTFLDICAGTGAVGFEAISRGAASVTFIEQSKLLLSFLIKNSQQLGLTQQCKILGGDARVRLTKLGKEGLSYNLIYLDPPYPERTLYRDLLGAIAENHLIAPGGTLIVEYNKGYEPDFTPFPFTIDSLRPMGNSTLALLKLP